jgi:DNA helicase-2/ATP-dependent DNA helicase PcrA
VQHLQQAARERGMSLFEMCRHAEALPQFGTRAHQAVARFVKLIDGLLAKMAGASLTNLTEAVIADSGYRQALQEERSVQARGRLENVNELLSATREYEEGAEEPTLAGFLEGVALLTSADSMKEGVEAVPLMTVHSAKGLEFPVVFLVGLEEGLFPLARAAASDNPMELEEERRLAYVAITRAKERLFISSGELRTIFGTTNHTLVSRFLNDLPDDVHEPSGLGAPRQITWQSADLTRAPRGQEMLLTAEEEEAPFRAGDRVRHATFGDGMVVQVSGSGAELLVTVAFPKKGIKKLDPQYANLEKV